MSAITKSARRLLRELEFELHHRCATEDEIVDLRVIENVARDLREKEEPCRRERAAAKVGG